MAHQGAVHVSHYMSDQSLFVTFWTGSAIMFVTFLIALYFARAHAADYSDSEVSAAT